MYQFSRSIYRQLKPMIREGEGCADSEQRILDACESTMQRLLNDRRYFARPTKTLFHEIRACFAIHDQLEVYRVVDHNVRLAILYLKTTPPEQLPLEGSRECRAHTRKGSPCQREPLPGRDYCPSHKHLEEHDGALAPVVPAAAAA